MAAKAAKAAPAARAPTKQAGLQPLRRLRPRYSLPRSGTGLRLLCRTALAREALCKRDREVPKASTRLLLRSSRKTALATIVSIAKTASAMVTGESPDYSNQPVSVLREMCRQLGLDDSGRKWKDLGFNRAQASAMVNTTVYRCQHAGPKPLLLHIMAAA